VGAARLAALHHIDVEVAPGRGFRELASSYARLGIARDIAMVVPSFVSAAALVAATDFVATVPTTLVGVLGDALRIRAIATPVPRLTVHIKLAWHERTLDDPALRAFRDLVERVARGDRRS
jgi:DNA-binding transcriptional LysR family regulator